MSSVLIAEDDEDVSSIMQTIVKELGATVLTCGDGMACLQLVKQMNPSLLLLDINMPQLNGLEVLKELSDKDMLDGMQVVMITGEADKTKVAEAIKLGAKDFVVKPFEADGLKARIKPLLES